MGRNRIAAILAVAAAVALAGGVVAPFRHGAHPKAVVIPLCGRPAATIAWPSALPAGLSLPNGTAFTRVSHLHGVPVIEGRTPLGLVGAARFLTRELPRAGFRLSGGEQEVGYEAESDYAGHSVSGAVQGAGAAPVHRCDEVLDLGPPRLKLHQISHGFPISFVLTE